MRHTNGRFAMALVGLGLITSQDLASPITFVGEDIQPTPSSDVRTNSDAAAAAFTTAASALGQVGVITFESSPLGSFNSLTVAPGVSISGTDVSGNQQTIRNTSNFPANPTLDGSNTTAGGSQFVEMVGGTLVFTFAQPTQFFGAYLTGVQTSFFPDTITFSDGTTESITLAGAGTTASVGEIAFVGFTDSGKSITSITINTGNSQAGWDDIGVDDVSFQTSSVQAVPEPSSLAMLGSAAGLAIVSCSWVRCRRTLRLV